MSDLMIYASSYGEEGLSHGDLESKNKQEDKSITSVIFDKSLLADSNLGESQ